MRLHLQANTNIGVSEEGPYKIQIQESQMDCRTLEIMEAVVQRTCFETHIIPYYKVSHLCSKLTLLHGHFWYKVNKIAPET